MEHNISKLSADMGPTPAPDWVLNPPASDSREAAVIAIRIDLTPEGAGEVDMWSTHGDPVMHYLVLEGLLQAMSHVLVSKGFVRGEDGGWEKT